jgi:hypothetical protein
MVQTAAANALPFSDGPSACAKRGCSGRPMQRLVRRHHLEALSVSQTPNAEPQKEEPPNAEPQKEEPPNAEPPKEEPPKEEPQKEEPQKEEPPKVAWAAAVP